MLTQQTLEALDAIAHRFVDKLRPLALTTGLIVRNQHKFDRVDTKLLKEADKLIKKEKNSVKQEYRAKQRVGAITYKSYSIAFKKQLIAQIREQLERTHQPLSKIIRAKAKEQKIHPKNLTRWYQTKELKKKQGGRRARFPEMEIRLANFIRCNPKMKRKHILRQARQIMADLKIPGWQTFNFSKGWYQRFRERMNKDKIAKGARLDDVKIEAKSQFQTKCEEDYQVKKEEDAVFYDDDDDDNDSQGFDESSDEEEEKVKIEEEWNEDSEDQHDDVFNAKLSDSQESQPTQTYKQKIEQSLFFDDDQASNPPSANLSVFQIIDLQRKNLPIRRSPRLH